MITNFKTAVYLASFTAIAFIISFLLTEPSQAYAHLAFIPPPTFNPINVTDHNFKAQMIISGLDDPTGMTFVGNDILVNELHTGHVRHFTLQGIEKPLALDLSKTVTFLNGIISSDNTVYVYGTVNFTNTTSLITKNVVYQYNWNGNSLINQTVVKILNGGLHNGGVFAVGNDRAVYTIDGEGYGSRGPTQNQVGGTLDDTSIIVTVNQPGNVIVPSSALNPLDQYYAIGIRNSFGLTIDPVTGKLWDTENGPDSGDEINLVFPKFNSGWYPIAGFGTSDQIASIPPLDSFVYHDPSFAWEKPVAPTSLTFIQSKPLGIYNNTLVVGDFNNGKLYKFKLNSTRTGFVFNDNGLKDLTENIGDNTTEITFVTGNNAIVDTLQGPDGFLYVLDISNRAIYRIMPASQTPPDVIHSLNSTVVSSTQVNLVWNKPQPGGASIQGYNIFRNVNNGGLKLLASVSGASTTSYSDNSLNSGDSVKYGVRAVSTIGKAPFAFTGIIKVTTSTVPAPITDLSLNAISSTQVNLSWTKPSDGGSPITSYLIYRSLNGSGFSALTSIDGTLTSYADTTLHPGDAVTYAMKAVNSVGRGPVSNIPVSVKTPL
ncbi:MAG: PQQ-dependent sugar dehydrogenase [Thaumarchaeota archaeon]|nr:PQQ-dependent sugar dehydrogenase [Nitrososphaerota archaeon]